MPLLRHELEHAVRVATEIIDQDPVIVIGSQSILGTWSEDELPPIAILSNEVDIAPLNDDDTGSLATKLDAFAGEMSPFHERQGWYIQGVGRETAVLPSGWQDRLVPVSSDWTQGRVGLCLDPIDLCVAKLAAHRGKDLVFVDALLDAGLVDRRELIERIGLLDEAGQERAQSAARSWVEAWTSTADRDFGDVVAMPKSEPVRRGGVGSNQHQRKP